ncbi:hypothetical protein [Cellulomonas humilata]|uniref:Uncharacterized protein n=1 Tax=Cellulomonas humilata TaxID=144055 RepID=A0ABU0EF60_9CELL|nr:hypothetical protein [Cellulomonas humilata]MDQ0373909.1 hypothetical protein [Cellulomonas humilata]
MLGTILGLFWAASFVSGAASGAFDERAAGQVIGAGLVCALIAVIVGQVFRNTAGIALMFALGGALIGAVVELVRGHASMAGALVLIAVIFWVAQTILAIPRRRRDVLAFRHPQFVAPLPPEPRPALPEDPERKKREHEEWVRHRAATNNDAHAWPQVWFMDGEPVRDPSTLVEGEVYALGYDMGIYRGVFHGRRFEGWRGIDDEPEVRDWYAFETSGSEEPAASILQTGLRLPAESFIEEEPRVVQISVSQDEAMQAFNALRAETIRMAAGRALYGGWTY